MAPSPTPGTTPPPVWVSLVPTLLLGILAALVVLWLARRKGCSRWLALLAFVPCVGWLVIFYLLARTDQRVLDDIDALKRQIGAQHGDDTKR
jgi:hypothetical protein